ncbi:MAG: DUF1929 domain-containing protein [Gammaproteobacteria bacterium]|nr:DUF1929 domain-containing protein [Gammaproteobacteria bacterium]
MTFKRRDIFLKIEFIKSYSPLAPALCARRYGKDCMFNEGHELGRVTPQEILDASLDALVYREYLDPHYLIPHKAKIIPADTNEPPWDRRVPGTILYATPGERLYIHVLNGDPHECHSLHLHGLNYGIDSDGAWPLGVQSADGRRSDEIKPGESWTYVFDVTQQMIGAWAFHDHVREVQRSVNRGLFGGLVVRDPLAVCPDHEIPIFIHVMQASSAGFAFDSKQIVPNAVFEIKPQDNIFDHPGTAEYYCSIHGTSMAGRIVVDPNSTPFPAPHPITMKNLAFTPQSLTIHPSDTVRWINNDGVDHVVFSPGGGKATFCLNGRAYVGNTPTIVAESGERLRWYVFNLDMGSVWHNFHPHATRWQLPVPPGGASDVHSLSPVETFVADTIVPPAIRLPCALEDLQCDPPPHACRVRIKGDFLFHCHIEEHMMQGLAGLVRARQYLWVTEEVVNSLSLNLPYEDGSNDCQHVDVLRCQRGKREPHPGDPANTPHGKDAKTGIDVSKAATEGLWELLPCDSQVLAVHAAVLHTGKVLFMAGSGNSVKNFAARVFRAIVWDYQNGTFKTLQTPTDIFCSGHEFLPDGRLLVAGGTLEYQSGDVDKGTLKGFKGASEAYLFDPILEDFIRVDSMRDGRWYPSLITLPDGQILTVSGLSSTLNDPDPKPKGNQFSKINEEHEIYSQAHGWAYKGNLDVKGKPQKDELPTWPLYPHLFVIRDGRLFYSGGHVFGSNKLAPGWLDVATNAFSSMSISADSNPFDKTSPVFELNRRDQSASVLLPPAQDQRVMVMGGGGTKDLKPESNTNPVLGISKVHIVDLKAATPAYTQAKSMHLARMHLNAVLLPDRTVLVSGGEAKSERATEAALHAEIYDAASNSWTLAAKATVPRMYHSIALLLPDGRVITAGSNPESADPGGGELRLELFHPPYLFRGPRPFIEHVTQEIHYGEVIEIETPQAQHIQWISLIRPMATTHSWDSSQRLVDIPIERCGFCQLHGLVPHEPTIAPPGWYMLFIIDKERVPSVARWVHLSRKEDSGHISRH